MRIEEYYRSYGNTYGIEFLGGSLLLLLIVWSIVWKAMGLWRAARNGDKVWFVVFLLVHTLGILEILYLYVFGKHKSEWH